MAFARPGATVGLWLLVLACSLFFATSLRVETTVDSVLDRTGEEWAFYQESQGLFGGDEVIVVMIPSADPYALPVLKRVHRLSDQLAAIPGVRRVDSIATVPVIASDTEGELLMEAPATAARLREAGAEDKIRRLVEGDDDALGLLVSESGRSFALNILLEKGAYEESGQILDRVAELAGDDGLWSGVPVFRNETNKRTERELIAFVPLTASLMLGLLLLLFRSVALAVLPLATGVVSAAVVVGVMGALELPLTISTLILPTVLLALGCAYSMHPISAALAPAAAGESDGLEGRVLSVALPVALSGLTTAIGFVALSAVRIEAIRQVGGLGALGAVVATLAVLTLLPALLTLVRLPVESATHRWLRRAAPHQVVRIVDSHRIGVLGVFGVVCVVALVGLPSLRVESDVIQWFPRGDPLRVSYEAIRDELSGISPVNVVVTAKGGASISEPEVLVALDGLCRHLESLPTVSNATSIATPVQQLSAVFSDGQQFSPDDVSTIEQYLLVLSADERVQDFLSVDGDSANVWVRARSNASEDLLEVARQAEGWWHANGPEWTDVRSTGIMFEFARAQRAISWGQVTGLGFAFLAIMAVLLLAFGSIGIALLSLLPNVVPILLSFGLLSWLGVPLDAGTALVGNMAIGIAVDDTIHLVSALRGKGGVSFVSGLARPLSVVVPPICLTTLVLAAGFALLGFSSFLFIRNLGLLTALILVVCMLADLFLLPCAFSAGEAIRKWRLKAVS